MTLAELQRSRRARQHGIAKDDQRTPFQRDRDRILYSSAFRRLAGITQIVRAGEADVFHTRQQHTIKVAQVGRRLAERLIEEQHDLAAEIDLNAEVIEAACLAHDLGHPPFGHVGEHELDQLVSQAGGDGFEGNAQSFRILTKLAVRFEECDGLDLTRATLAATLKYPWIRDAHDAAKTQKWGAYPCDKQDFNFARDQCLGEARTPEAELMDWADDIAYSVHDLEDFHRCAALPWYRIFSASGEEQIVRRALSAWFNPPTDAEARLRKAFRGLSDLMQTTFRALFEEQYEGSRQQRHQLRTMTSTLIGRYIKAVVLDKLSDSVVVKIAEEEAAEVRVLKQITRSYIIENPSLVGQQKGQRLIIRNLFQNIFDDGNGHYPTFLPTRLRYLWDLCKNDKARFAADCVASLTETEAVLLHNRLTGVASGSVLDPIIR